jgi:Cu+-exporting ATPase
VSETELARIELAVPGMTCAAGAVRVECTLNRLDQVSATVSLATERAAITAPVPVPVSDLIGAVRAAGYGARTRPPPAPAVPAPERPSARATVIGLPVRTAPGRPKGRTAA